MNNSNETSLKERNNQVFIGARKLSNNEVKRLLSNFDTIKTKIEDFRNTAIENAKNENNYKAEYTNTISILGARGTGKTSVMYTIKNDLKDDIVLEMIKPDNITSSGTITANILGQLKNVMNDILSKIKKSGNEKVYPLYFKNCVYKEQNPLTETFDEMYEYFCYSEDEYKKTLISTYTNFSTYATNSSKILNADKYFQDKLAEFIDKLVEIKKELNNNDTQPLLIVLIDDIDLRTSKVEEIINALQSYSISDKVVTIVSGDYNTFVDSLHIALINKDNLPNGFRMYDESNDTTYFDNKKILAHEFIKKLLPIAFRYEIKTWDLNGRANYSFSITDKDGKETNLILMEMLLELIRKCGCDISFFYYVEGDEKYPLEDFYNIFDNTARGLVNVFYSLNDALSLDFTNGDVKFAGIKSLVDTIINSNSILLEYKDVIYKNFILWGNNEETTQLKFEKLKSFQNKNYQKINGIFNLMYFTSCCFINSKTDKIISPYFMTKMISNNDSYNWETLYPNNTTKNTPYTYYYFPLLKYSYNFSIYLYYSFKEFQTERAYENWIIDSDSENRYFYSFYKGVTRYCSVMEKNNNNVQNFLNRVFYSADNEILPALNRIIDIVATDKLLINGNTWLYSVFSQSLNERYENYVEKNKLDTKRYFEMFFINMLNLIDFSSIVKDIDNKTTTYIENAKNILPNWQENPTEIYKNIYKTIKIIVNFLSIDNTNKNIEKIRKSLTKNINEIGKNLNDLVFENYENDDVVNFNENGQEAFNDFANKGIEGEEIKECCSFKDYIDCLDKLNNLRSNDMVSVGRNEALVTYEELTKYPNVQLKFSDELTKVIKSDLFKSFIQLYVVYSKSNNKDLDLDFNSKVADAKEEFYPLLKNAYKNSVDELKALTDEYGIEEN